MLAKRNPCFLSILISIAALASSSASGAPGAREDSATGRSWNARYFENLQEDLGEDPGEDPGAEEVLVPLCPSGAACSVFGWEDMPVVEPPSGQPGDEEAGGLEDLTGSSIWWEDEPGAVEEPIFGWEDMPGDGDGDNDPPGAGPDASDPEEPTDEGLLEDAPWSEESLLPGSE